MASARDEAGRRFSVTGPGADLCGALGAPAAPDPAIRALGCDDVRSTMDAIRERETAPASSTRTSARTS